MNKINKEQCSSNIGGQALIEGLLMISRSKSTIAIRKPDGEIHVKNNLLPKKSLLSKIPIIRGAINLIHQLILGIKAIMYSSEFVDIEEDQSVTPSKVDKFIDKLFGSKIKDAVIYFSVFISLAFSIVVFMLFPNFLAGFFHFNKSAALGLIYYNLVEGVIRVFLFLSYIILVSHFSKDIQRIWQYHGAEHKSIHCYENNEELTVENIKKYSTLHPRCGTAFLFTVMIISIFVFSFAGWHNVFINALLRVLLVPLVAGISYELLRFAGSSRFKIAQLINYPGLMLQKYTTKEPDNSQIEVAIAAINSLLEEEN